MWRCCCCCRQPAACRLLQVYFALSAAITAAALLLYHLVLPQLDVVAYYRGRLHGESTIDPQSALRALYRHG
jgi:hypothetical protein